MEIEIGMSMGIGISINKNIDTDIDKGANTDIYIYYAKQIESKGQISQDFLAHITHLKNKNFPLHYNIIITTNPLILFEIQSTFKYPHWFSQWFL